MCSSAKTGGWFLYNKYLTVEEIQLATVFYIREDSQPDNIVSSREVSVDDLINLYGSAPSSYKYMKGASSPYANIDQGPENAYSDPAHVVVKIEGNEVNQDTFTKEGFYIVRDIKPE
jgi:hypothetical protein